MKISVAQTRPVRGNIEANIQQHLKLIALAAENQADLIVFHELSLTGYEPELAEALATDREDRRFDVFQQKSDTDRITIGVGMPLKSERGITISMIIFQPESPREVYTKYYLHEDELPYFVSEKGTVQTIGPEQHVALAICYEISIEDHARKACDNDAAYYLASVAKTESGVKKAEIRLKEIAQTYNIPVMMANCIGPCEGQPGGGKTGAWNKEGVLLTALDQETEGLVIYDTSTDSCTQHTLL